jgi:hypothetical protein
MAISTNFKWRLKNANLPATKGLLSLFEAVVNHIHSIEESAAGCAGGDVSIGVLREEEGLMGLTSETEASGGPPLVRESRAYASLFRRRFH